MKFHAWPRRSLSRDPLTAEDRKELRWYLEEYLSFPYGAERDRAAGVGERMAKRGEALFAQLFPRGDAQPNPQAFYQEAVRDGLDQCELCISSEDPAFLGLPWESCATPPRAAATWPRRSRASTGSVPGRR